MLIYKEAGALLFGTRLKRLSENFLSDLLKIYQGENIQFEIAWFPVFYLLDKDHEVTISGIAGSLDITHSGASQIVTSLKKKGFVQISQVSKDKRIKTVSLTTKGRKKISAIKPIWRAVQESIDDIVDSGGKRNRILCLVDELEEIMAQVNLVELVQKRLSLQKFLEQIDIVEYQDTFHDSFMALVLRWISENPETLPEEVNWVNHTRREVIEQGNAVIYMAAHLGEVISACVATIDSKKHCSTLTSIFERSRVSDNITRVLLDKVTRELEKRNIKKITTTVDISRSDILTILQEKMFKLMDIEKGMARGNTCIRLSRQLGKETT